MDRAIHADSLSLGVLSYSAPRVMLIGVQIDFLQTQLSHVSAAFCLNGTLLKLITAGFVEFLGWLTPARSLSL